jgi:glycosyltransferase involved in cell wall biosynthesis
VNAWIVNCFDTYNERVELVEKYLTNTGYNVIIIESDFSHSSKTYKHDFKTDRVYIKSKSYNRNMSISRLLSHYLFSKSVYNYLFDKSIDLMYVLIPPNSLAKYASKLRNKRSDMTLVFDLIDLWPETLPLKKISKLPIMHLWANSRNRFLKEANLVITECDLYQSVLSKYLISINSETLYLAKKDIEVSSTPNLSTKTIDLAYLGSINNIIDVDAIVDIISTILTEFPVNLHIIGDGENKHVLVNETREIGANIIDHGKIYNPQEKQDIFDRCHYGLNIMKKSVCVGLTMKSIDYFQFGIPIINNIPADTTRLIENKSAGYNLYSNNFNFIFPNLQMRKNSREIYQEFFSEAAFLKSIDEIFQKHLFNKGQ